MKKTARILIIDDERDMLDGCSKILRVLGHNPVSAGSGALALQFLQREEFDLILCDLYMPEIDGMQLLQKANELAPNTPVVIFTAYGTIDRAVAAMKRGAFDFIEKPFEVEHLKVVVEKGLQQHMLYRERTNLLKQLEDKFSFNNIIGQSAVMRKVFEMIENIATTDANVLITGESGTGKELIARSIHARSKRNTKAFVPINCSAFPENLFEAELFGYEKGAFTGATQRKHGLLEFADGGTFFLDEVCELPVTLQAKLLRVLQDQQLRHIGGNELIQIDVRLISASNRNLEQARSDGLLRDDFYYRLNVINIHLPPLRQRREDIPLLAHHFLHQQLKSSSKVINGFHPQVLQKFEEYDWPGNVRELENVVERAIALATGNEIVPSDLPAHITKINTEDSQNQALASLSLVEAKKRAIDEIEKNYLITHLKMYQGNVTKIAQKAQMTRRNLHRLLNRHGLKPANWR